MPSFSHTTTSRSVSNASHGSNPEPGLQPSLVSVSDKHNAALATEPLGARDNVKKADRPSKHRRHSDVHRTLLDGTGSSRQSSHVSSRRKTLRKSISGPRRSSTSPEPLDKASTSGTDRFSGLRESTTPVQQSNHLEAHARLNAQTKADGPKSPSTRRAGPTLGGFPTPGYPHAHAMGEVEKRMSDGTAPASYHPAMTPPYSPAQQQNERPASSSSSAATMALQPHNDWQSSQGQENTTDGPNTAVDAVQLPHLHPALPLVDQRGLQWRGVNSPQLYARAPQNPQSLMDAQHDPRLENQEQALRDYINSNGQVPFQFRGQQVEDGRFDPRFQWRNPRPHQQNLQHYPSVPSAPIEAENSLKHTGSGSQLVSKPSSPSTSMPNPSSMTLEGYELLATKLADASHGIKPMYRSFEALNHRVLLYLQDEICELEESLRGLDEAISQTSGHDAATSKPASRRAEAHLLPSESELHFRRKFILGEICVKMERYYRVLEACHSTSKNLEQPRPRDVATYKQWMSENHPIDDAEAAFLQHQQDLVVLPRRRCETSVITGAAAVLPLLLLFLPLLIFSLIPNLLGRFLTIAIITMIQWVVGSVMEIRHVLTLKEWIACTGVYATLMVSIAAISHY